eukprot:CAMPEP_0173218378 /NCGR_PEP_ID=MMETSP1142-20121109/1019_1 /TAXON_ID=483371 /ORGANISM="non described non described, Strain CCMP2298" /LENGTH=98 /DNA_ID=CAMNT_0014146065 /DNA_START=161 /DNA_END=454 /DNA_ORIENTATION=-
MYRKVVPGQAEYDEIDNIVQDVEAEMQSMSGAKDDSPDLYRPGRQSNQSNPSNPSNPSNSRPQDQTSQRPRQAQTKALPLRQVSLPSDDEDLDAGAGG